MPPPDYASPEAFEEALSWFRERVPMTDPAFREVQGRARRLAFWVAGASNLDTVNDVWDAIERSLAKGSTLEDFKREVGDKLAAEWGKPDSARLEVIFRNNLQTAYSAGRYRLETAPAVRKRRPYREFVPLLDSRTTVVCRNLKGVIRRTDDPWWLSHYPPLHHQCRSITRLLREEQLEGRGGVTEELPRVEVPEGWGSVPSRKEWEPDLAKYPPALRKALPKTPPD
jgi:SPP1 gp7 family putative phage head morphogenesis protein